MVIARLRDLTLLRAEGVEVEPMLATEVVTEAEAWVTRVSAA